MNIKLSENEVKIILNALNVLLMLNLGGSKTEDLIRRLEDD